MSRSAHTDLICPAGINNKQDIANDKELAEEVNTRKPYPKIIFYHLLYQSLLNNIYEQAGMMFRYFSPLPHQTMRTEDI